MKSLLLLCTAIVAATLICSCAGGGAPLNLDTTQSVATLEAEMQRTDAAVPSVEQYLETRGDFLAQVRAVQLEQDRMAGSSASKIKNIISAFGVTVALGGTTASLLVDDDGDKATISQTSAAVAGVSGLIGLLPFGATPKGAQSIQKYLSIEIPAFEERWPSNLEGPLEPAEWNGFVYDMKQMERVVEALGE